MGILDNLPFRKKTRPPKEKKSEVKQRAQWGSQTEFLLTCIGYAVGLGNVWRFPYLCYKNGGGAFLIPYFVMTILMGMPLLFMEYCFGQYFGVGALTIWKISPLFKGIGAGYVVLNGLVCIYYNVIIAISLYYLFASFRAVLPWSSCDNPWNTPLCDTWVEPNTTMINGTVYNMTTTVAPMVNLSNVTSNVMYNITHDINGTLVNNITHVERTPPTEEYWKYYLLEMTDGIHNLGGVRWHLALCLLLAWVFVCLFLMKGIKSSGKVVYFTATFPYVMLTVLVIRGATLEGSIDGILYFVTPDWAKLKDPEVWYAAATQLFYSTNIAWGGMITMSSYNNFHHNCLRDAILINFVAFLTSLYAGFAVFAVIGYMAKLSGKLVKDVISSGPGLAFIVYPRALGLMPLAPMWSALFFFMLFLLGIGSQMVSFETVITGLVDEFPVLRKRRWLPNIIFATLFFLLGLPCITQGGMYVLNLMDWYAAGFCLLCIACFEAVAINYAYGHSKFCDNVFEMLNFRPNLWWKICWMVISPCLVLGVLIFSFVKYTPVTYGKYAYPAWADGLGWMMALSSVLPIFVIGIYIFITTPGDTYKEKFLNSITPEKDIANGRIDKDVVPRDDSGNDTASDESLNGDNFELGSGDALIQSGKEKHHKKRHGSGDKSRHTSGSGGERSRHSSGDHLDGGKRSRHSSGQDVIVHENEVTLLGPGADLDDEEEGVEVDIHVHNTDNSPV